MSTVMFILWIKETTANSTWITPFLTFIYKFLKDDIKRQLANCLKVQLLLSFPLNMLKFTFCEIKKLAILHSPTNPKVPVSIPGRSYLLKTIRLCGFFIVLSNPMIGRIEVPSPIQDWKAWSSYMQAAHVEPLAVWKHRRVGGKTAVLAFLHLSLPLSCSVMLGGTAFREKSHQKTMQNLQKRWTAAVTLNWDKPKRRRLEWKLPSPHSMYFTFTAIPHTILKADGSIKKKNLLKWLATWHQFQSRDADQGRHLVE